MVEVGDGAGDHFAGERVVGAAPAPCGRCKHCRAGFPANCDLVLEMILGVDELASGHGAFAERIRVDARRLRRLPEGVDTDDGALAEPASVAAHAVDRSGVGLGDLVVVLGAGTIGLIVAELARIAGAGRVVAVDPVDRRRELACDLGADAAFAPGRDARRWLDDHGHGLGADVVFDCVGADDALHDGVEMARRRGTVVAVGVSGLPARPVPADLVRREVDLVASLGYTTADVQRVLDLLAEDRLRVESLRRPEPIGLADLAAVLEELDGDHTRARTVLVDPSTRG